MHFSSAAAVVVLSSLGITYAAPFANPQAEIARRKVSYQVVNVDGDPTSSAAPETETVTETIQSVTTAPGTALSPITVTVTATPSSTPTPTSTPHSHVAPPPGASFFPAPSSGAEFFRRGLMAAGDPLQFARGYESSTASVTVIPLAATPVVARDFHNQDYPSVTSSATPSSSFTLSPSAYALLY